MASEREGYIRDWIDFMTNQMGKLNLKDREEILVRMVYQVSVELAAQDRINHIGSTPLGRFQHIWRRLVMDKYS